ncbi:Protein-disulfide isomerase [Loktanella fryxellensis]|uniref:Protein-disulfide isomerase n=1 Tax=Loktanella fryxellensis TaxID=245187 RepID=A0A1H7YRM5_9RHOB|nr:DsbA family protein [Loktanella fryxellensis]SEM48504.1 Protein-disulfide isomerase [Loktanella fryxellensis]
MTRALLTATALTLTLGLPAAAQDDDAAFGERVRAYLLENPQVIMEAVGILQAQEAEMAALADQDMVAAQSEALLNDGYSWVGGNPDGDITVVEFMDYRCGYCKRAFPEIESLLQADGNIRFIVKEFPILGEQSVLASQFAMAAQIVAGEDAYKAVHETLMSFNGEITEDSLLALADSLDLDGAAIMAGTADPEVERRIAANRALGESLAISGTPTFVVQDQMVRGYVPAADLQRLVDDLRG